MCHRRYYVFVLTGLITLVTLALGNGPFDRPADYEGWNYRLFAEVCHQMPERSLNVAGTPMAVNSRCFGVFSGLLAAWLMIPVLGRILKGSRWPVWMLLVVAVWQGVDVAASWLSVWNSSNFSRFFSGLLLGVAVILPLAEMFRENRTNRPG